MNDETVNTWLNKSFMHAFYGVIIIALVLYMKCCSACPQPVVIGREERKVSKDSVKLGINHAPVNVEGTGKITPRPRRVLAHTPIVATGTTLGITPDSGLVANNSVPLAMVDSLEPFTASLDTTVGKDSIQAKYYFPENQFRIEFKRAADSVDVVNTTYEITRYVEPAWYAQPAVVASATATAILAIFLLVK